MSPRAVPRFYTRAIAIHRLSPSDRRIWQSTIVCTDETMAVIALALAFFLTDRSIGARTREPHLYGAAFPAPSSAAFQRTPEERGYNVYPSYECIRQ
jgi:hypothetical protein